MQIERIGKINRDRKSLPPQLIEWLNRQILPITGRIRSIYILKLPNLSHFDTKNGKLP